MLQSWKVKKKNRFLQKDPNKPPGFCKVGDVSKLCILNQRWFVRVSWNRNLPPSMTLKKHSLFYKVAGPPPCGTAPSLSSCFRRRELEVGRHRKKLGLFKTFTPKWKGVWKGVWKRVISLYLESFLTCFF